MGFLEYKNEGYLKFIKSKKVPRVKKRNFIKYQKIPILMVSKKEVRKSTNKKLEKKKKLSKNKNEKEESTIKKKEYPEIKEKEKKGLSNEEASKRLKKHGENKIKKEKTVKPIKIFFLQFTSPLILLLIAAALVSYSMKFLPGEEARVIDTILILGIVLISGIVGFLQEYKAEKSVKALQKMATPKTIVIRGGVKREIPINKVVPGDVVLLEQGDVVPADSEIFDQTNLRIDESILTGESESVNKQAGEVVYKNTSVYVGHAKALVRETGMNTQVGNIAKKLQTMKEGKTPFQKEVASLSKKLIYIIGAIIVLVGIVSIFKYDWVQSLLIAVSLAVAAVPEGLPAAVTSVLAIGSRVMAKKNSLVRKLSVTESIGSVDVICSDKTGTLTKNQMTVTNLYTNKEIKAKDIKEKDLNSKNSERLKKLLLSGLLCNNSEKKTLASEKGKEKEKYSGDQTEVALKEFGEKFYSEEYLNKFVREEEVSFTSNRKMMSVLVKNPKGNNYTVYSKGAPEVLLNHCTKIFEGGRLKRLDKKKKQEIIEKNKEFASKGLRVLGFAYKETKKIQNKDNTESELVWIGLQAMRDPPHKEVPKAIKDCKTAGIRVIMITGDNPKTAEAIADEIGLESKGTLQGKDIEGLSDKELSKKLESDYNVFARVNPFHKLRILKLLRKKNQVVMTGDGVNDALALKRADVGVAMGIRGTEVAKQSSDMILLDDNFSTIRTAIKEGRRIFDNIRKFINYLLTTNTAEILVVFIATLFMALETPILIPSQILWINFLTDLFPALALGVDPAREGIMKEKPRKKGTSLISKRMLIIIGIIGSVMTLMLFGVFFATKAISQNMAVARSAVFTGLILFELMRVGVIRHGESLKWNSNKWLLAALGLSLILQLIAVYTPLGQKAFQIAPIYNPWIWAVLVAGTIAGYFISIFFTRMVDNGRKKK